MDIKILGKGCPNSIKLYEEVTSLVKEMNIDTEVKKIENINEIISYGVFKTPALVIDEVVKFSGKVPDKELIRPFLEDDNHNCSKCSCGGHCN